MTERRQYSSAWDSLDASPERIAYMKAKARLMFAIEDCVNAMGEPFAEQARRAGVGESRLRALLNGKIGSFSLNALVAMAYALGLEIQVTEKAA